MTIEHSYVGSEDDWYNTEDISELIEQVAKDKTIRSDLREFEPDFADEEEEYYDWD